MPKRKASSDCAQPQPLDLLTRAVARAERRFKRHRAALLAAEETSMRAASALCEFQESRDVSKARRAVTLCERIGWHDAGVLFKCIHSAGCGLQYVADLCVLIKLHAPAHKAMLRAACDRAERRLHECENVHS